MADDDAFNESQTSLTNSAFAPAGSVISPGVENQVNDIVITDYQTPLTNSTSAHAAIVINTGAENNVNDIVIIDSQTPLTNSTSEPAAIVINTGLSLAASNDVIASPSVPTPGASALPPTRTPSDQPQSAFPAEVHMSGPHTQHTDDSNITNFRDGVVAQTKKDLRKAYHKEYDKQRYARQKAAKLSNQTLQVVTQTTPDTTGTSQMYTRSNQRAPLGELQYRSLNAPSYNGARLTENMSTSICSPTQCSTPLRNKENIHPSERFHQQLLHNQTPTTDTHTPLDVFKARKRQYDKDRYARQKAQKMTAPNHPTTKSTRPRFQDDHYGTGNLLPLFESTVNPLSPIVTRSSTFIGESSTGVYYHNGNQLPLLDSVVTQSPPVITGSSTFTGESSTGIAYHNGNLLPSLDSVVTQSPPVITRSYTFRGESSTARTTQVNVHPSTINTDFEEDIYDFVYQGLPREHRVLKKPPRCRYCRATKFKYEYPTFCCMGGQTRLAVTNVPAVLYNLFTDQSAMGKQFRHNIRSYNTNFSFTSMGVSLDKSLANMTAGVYTFRVNGGIYHTMDQLIPRDGKPTYLQLYFYDPEFEFNQRSQWPNLDRNILRLLILALASNPYATTFRSMSQLGPLDNYRVSLNASVELDQRVYNKPTTSEVAGIWVEGNDNITSYKRSIVLYGRSQQCQRIQPYFGCYDPLSYPLFFPNGESGWHGKIPRHGFSLDDIHDDEDNLADDEDAEEGTNRSRGRKTVTMREYYSYKFQIRPTENVILLGGRLLQQFAVDIYIKLETSRLHFIEHNQARIRADLYQGIVDCIHAGEVQASRIGRRVVLPASFIGGPRDMRRRYLDAMSLVQAEGKPDLFLTFTCNPNWKEITDELEEGQTAQDRPETVARIFRAKLEDLKEQLLQMHVLGKIKAYVYVIEFQKRGLPHAHFLLIMKSSHRMTTPDQYDKLVCSEIPNPARYPQLHEIVVNHMLHGPCGRLNSKSPCMQGDLKQCRSHYPRQFNEHTLQGDDSYPLYRRRDNGITFMKGKNSMDNRWVVPYNPKLLMMFNCHMNLEICSSIKSVKYVFKYVYKGHDKQSVHVDPDQEEEMVNEIKRWQDARYVSAPEAMWRIFGFPLSKIYPSVMSLHLHLPKMHYVRFRDNEELSAIVEREQHQRSMLTAFFDLNRVNPNARQYLYKDIPKHFTWHGSSHVWRNREGKKKMRGRVVSANPAEGERYYLRVLLMHVKGPESFDDLYTANGEKHTTFRKSALERGLIENDDCLSQCLGEASVFQFPHSLRRLFATILVFCDPGDVRRLWDEHYESLSEDHRRNCQNSEQVQNMVLRDLLAFLQSMGKNLRDFDLPHMSTNQLQSRGCRELQEETSIVIEDAHLCAKYSLNPDQKSAYDSIIRHVDESRPGVFFIDGPGGTGKTFLYTALLAEIRSRGLIALATASSGAAANNMPGGRTAHSRFKIPLMLDNNSLCNISKQSGTAQLLCRAMLIIWDEASMAKRQAVEALDRTMQDITGVKQPFGGKIMVLGGDFRQVLPVVRKGTRGQIVDSSLRMSPLWPGIKKIRLTVNMRARTDPWFSHFLLRVGDGEEEVIEESFIRVPDDMTIPYTTEKKSKEDLVNAIFPSIQVNGLSPGYIISRAILSTKNENVDEISVSGLPPHHLRLKVGCPVILLRNIDPSNGLCNGTRLICKGFQRNVIDAEIAVGQHAGKSFFAENPFVSIRK